jgi:hypothetical protein
MSVSRCLYSRAGLVVAALGLGLIIAPAAHAFTLQESDGSTTDPRQRYLELDTKPVTDPTRSQSRFGGEGTTTIQQGGVTLQFRRERSFDEKYSTDHYFDPLGKPPGVR